MIFARITALLALAFAALGQEAAITTRYSFSHGIPPRKQWDANFGYCGETSFISAGLHFGQYCSQFTARSLASPGAAQSSEESQLLLGVNDEAAARKMRLQATAFSSDTQRSIRALTDWIKDQTLKGHVVILGLFNNGIVLDEWTDITDGDPTYDHIVPVLGWGSNHVLADHSSTAFGGDVITFSDNGLFGEAPTYQFLYSLRMSSLPANRRQANNPNGLIYRLKNRAPNFAIAIAGPLDLDGVLVPVKLDASQNNEPELADGANAAPTPNPLTLTATVTIHDTSVAHTLYYYDDFAKVPVANFNANAAAAKLSWNIPANSGSTFSTAIQTNTGATAVFRAVRQSAP
jgi:hypothetical protein